VRESFPSHGVPSIYIFHGLNTIYTLRYSFLL